MLYSDEAGITVRASQKPSMRGEPQTPPSTSSPTAEAIFLKLDFGFVPFPREIWERPIDLTKAEFRLLGWFLCRLKIGVQQGTYTDKDLLEGSDGLPGVRLGRNNFKAAREGLRAHGLLEAVEVPDGKWRYRLPFGSVSETDTSSDNKNENCCPKRTPINLKESETDKETDIPSWVPKDPWDGFVEMRKKIRKPLTDRAKTLLLNNLEKLKNEGYDPGAILDQSTANSWQGVFPLRSNGNGQTSNAGTRQMRNPATGELFTVRG